jgi:hypothetical protein
LGKERGEELTGFGGQGSGKKRLLDPEPPLTPTTGLRGIAKTLSPLLVYFLNPEPCLQSPEPSKLLYVLYIL